MTLTRKSATALVLALFTATAIGYSVARAQDRPAFPKVEPVIKQALDDIENREVRMELVTFPPGAAAPEHHHPGHVFVYVLEGQIISQLDDGPADTFKAGDSFYEPTNGLHAVTKNPSDSETAKILVFMIMEEGKPSLKLGAH